MTTEHSPASAGTAPDGAVRTPDEALELLLAGNRRWAEGRPLQPNRTRERRSELAHGQHPFATVFTCIDSRVTPEIVFDCGLGDLAVVRSGAHTYGPGEVLGSLQFGVDRLRTPVLLVLGHQACGAVIAAVQAAEHGHELPEGLASIAESIRPAYEQVKDGGGDVVERTVQAHTGLTVRALEQAPLIGPLLDSGKVRILGGYYSFETGAVSILE